jgi:hypothetical protein
MVRCIPTFVILSLIASLTLNHPVSVDSVDEIIETAGIQAIDDDVEDIFATALPDNNSEVVPTNAPFLVEDITEAVDIQAVEIEEPTMIEDVDDESSTAGVQAVAEDVEEDIVAGIQGVEDVEEDDIEVAEATTPTSSADEVIAQAADDDKGEIEFELFEEGEEGDDEMTAAGVIDEEINSVQESAPVPNAENAAAFENLALEALNRLKILHIFRTSSTNKANRYLRGKVNARDNEVVDEQPVENINQTIFDVAEATEAPVTEVETAAPEEVTEAPTDIFEAPMQKRCVDDRCEDDDVHLALFDIEVETEKNDFETVTEMVTEVHVVSAIIDDDDQPTIGAIAIDPVQDQDVEEEIPLFGVIEEIEDEVQIAKRDEVFAEISYEIVEVSSEQQTPVEETTESLVISGVLIDLTEQEEQSGAATTEAVTDVVEEEPTIIN